MELNMSNGSSVRTAAELPIVPPGPGTRTGQVWEIADAITLEKGRRAQRHEVIERYVAENGNRNTASTQYQRWKIHRDRQHETSSPPRPEAIPHRPESSARSNRSPSRSPRTAGF